MGQAAPAQVQQLDDLVERQGVGGAGRVDREQAAQAAGQVGAGEVGLAGGHPVAVAADRVDLAVVGDHPERVGQRPGREGVGGEARVDQRDRADEPLVAQVGVELRHLGGRQHPLVDDGAGREADDGRAREAALADLALGLLAHGVGEPVEFESGRGLVLGGEEDLVDAGHGGPGGGAEAVGLDGHVPPADDAAALGDRVLPDDGAHAGGGVLVVQRRKNKPGGVMPGLWESEFDHVAIEGVGELEHDSRSVPRVRVRSGGSSVLHPDERGQTALDNGVGGPALHVCDESDATGVVLQVGAVQTRFGIQRETQPRPPSSSSIPAGERRNAVVSDTGRRRPERSKVSDECNASLIRWSSASYHSSDPGVRRRCGVRPVQRYRRERAARFFQAGTPRGRVAGCG